MKTTKKIFAGILGATMMFTSFSAVMAENTPTSVVKEISRTSASAFATVTEVSENGNYIVDTEEYGKLELTVSDETKIVDNKTGLNGKIGKNDKIYANFSLMMTKSIPAQTPASVIMTNINDSTPATYITVNEITKNDDGSVTVLDNEKQVFVTVTKDANVSPFKTKNIVTLADIEVGTKMLAWYDAVGLSLPARAATDRVILFEEPTNVETEVLVNGESIGITATNDNDTVVVPLRAVAEKMGFNVSWNNDEQSISLNKGDVSAVIKINHKGFYNKTKAVDFTGTPKLIEEKTYVPVELFKVLLGETAVETTSTSINFSTAK